MRQRGGPIYTEHPASHTHRVTKLAQLADSARVDWAGLALAVVTLAAYLLGADIDTTDVLVATILAAVGRGGMITAKRKAQQAHLIGLAKGAEEFVRQMRPEPKALPAAPEPTDDDPTAPIDVEERHG